MIDSLPELMLYASDSLVLESCVHLVFVYNLEASSEFSFCLELPDLSLDCMPNCLGPCFQESEPCYTSPYPSFKPP
jgi:hypothetical protein